MPQQTCWLANEQQTLLGEIRLRRYLMPPFEQYNGHIGYNTRPSQRGKDCAICVLATIGH